MLGSWIILSNIIYCLLKVLLSFISRKNKYVDNVVLFVMVLQKGILKKITFRNNILLKFSTG